MCIRDRTHPDPAEWAAVGAQLELWENGVRRIVPLDGSRVAIGTAEGNEVVVAGDPTVSRLHAVFERYAENWSVRDLGSSNGTFVDGERIFGERSLRSGDELQLGRTRVVFTMVGSRVTQVPTEVVASPPEITRRERDVLLSLCRPLLRPEAFTEPASVREIAAELSVSDAAVKQHIANLYDKFELYGTAERKRSRLANEAVLRGAVSMADLREAAD